MRHYWNGGKEKRAAWRAQPHIRMRLAARTARWKKANPDKVSAYLDRTRDQRRAQGTHANWRRKNFPMPTRERPLHCECCGERPLRTLHLDHDHRTGAFRGWLCVKCNTAIGKLGDDIEGVLRAVGYLMGFVQLPRKNVT
jgi:Recombination endonuclease VII